MRKMVLTPEEKELISDEARRENPGLYHANYLRLQRETTSRKPHYTAIAKNTLMELAATGLEALCSPFMAGGMTVTFEGIRDKKVLPYRVQ